MAQILLFLSKSSGSWSRSFWEKKVYKPVFPPILFFGLDLKIVRYLVVGSFHTEYTQYGI